MIENELMDDKFNCNNIMNQLIEVAQRLFEKLTIILQFRV